MKSYIPNTAKERAEMLRKIGLKTMGELYRDVPEGLILETPLDLPQGLSEFEVRRLFKLLASRNRTDLTIFRGAGAYNHYIPAAVGQLAARSEFYTAYTPYQAEMSQGMLQAIFEYQTLMCELTGLDVSNASVYDGATAACEAMLMLADVKRKRKVLYSMGLHPDVAATMHTYARFAGVELVGIPLGPDGLTDRAAVSANADGAAGLIAAQPNFYGCLEDMAGLSEAAHGFGGLFVSYVNPMTLGILARPGDYKADIAVGDGQPLGLPLSFGGPYLGFMTATSKLMRSMPGRIVGETTDADGVRAYVLTLQAREQHIRREKASSNICSNQMLCAIVASIYLALMGPSGLHEVAEQSLQKAHYLSDGLAKIPGLRLRYPNTAFFHEFTLDCASDAQSINDGLKARGIMGGLTLSRFDEDDRGMLWCATECNTREEIDALLHALSEVLQP